MGNTKGLPDNLKEKLLKIGKENVLMSSTKVFLKHASDGDKIEYLEPLLISHIVEVDELTKVVDTLASDNLKLALENDRLKVMLKRKRK